MNRLLSLLMLCFVALTPEQGAASSPRSVHIAGDGADESTLTIYAAAPDKDLKLAVVVCPGGGYYNRSMEHEGHRVAEWLAAEGITAGVLAYRLPHGNPERPLSDAEQALRILAEAGFPARRIGIMGFSAGGHLAAMIATTGPVRPAFSILFYPVISGDKGLSHDFSFDHLLGEGRTAELTAAYSAEKRVDAQTPPALLLLSDDDCVVPPGNSLRYYEALKAHGIPASLHIYPSGCHGWGINDLPFRADWQRTLLAWLKGLNPPNGE